MATCRTDTAVAFIARAFASAVVAAAAITFLSPTARGQSCMYNCIHFAAGIALLKAGQIAAVDRQAMAGHVGRCGRREEDCRADQIVECAKTPERNARQH